MPDTQCLMPPGGGPRPSSCTACPSGWTTPERNGRSRYLGFSSVANCTVKLTRGSSSSSALKQQASVLPQQDPVCPAGQMLTAKPSDEAVRVCRPCGKGSFNPYPSDHPSYDGCVHCSLHFTTAGEGSTSANDCRLCQPGRGRPRNKPSCECAPCAKGSYSGKGWGRWRIRGRVVKDEQVQ